MKKLKYFNDYLLLLEKLRLSEVRELVKKWKDAGGDKRYNEWFNDKHRLLIPFQPLISSIQIQVIKFLREQGYEDIDYVEGVCKDPKNPNQQPKISKILSRFNPDLKNKFDSDREKAKRAQGDLTIVVSRHAYDLASMTTDRKWHNSSCMEFRAGSNRHYVTCDVMEGSLVAYLINKSDKNIDNPLSRILIKPFLNKENREDVILWTESRVYGDMVNGFKESVEKWLKKIQPNIVGEFELKSTLYVDGEGEKKFYKWFNEYDDVYKHPNRNEYIVYKDGKCGLVDNHNDVIIPLEYDAINSTIYTTTLIAVKNGKYGIIINRKPVTEFIYDSIEVPLDSYEYLFIIKKDRKYGYIQYNEWGTLKNKVDTTYDYLEFVSGRYILIFRQDGKYGIIRSDDCKVLLRPTYDKLTKTLNFKIGNKIGILSSGTYLPLITIDEKNADEILGKSDHDFMIKKDGKVGLIDSDGNLLVPCEYDAVNYRNRENNTVIIYKRSLSGIYSCKDKKEILPCEYIISTTTNKEILFLMKDNKWGIFYKGEIKTPCQYKNIKLFLAPIINATKFDGNIDTINIDNGKVGHNMKIESVIDRNTIFFSSNKKWGICNDNFDIKLPAKWDSLESYIKIDNIQTYKCHNYDIYSIGLIDINGNVILPCEYESISSLTKDFFILNKNGKFGLMKLPENKIILDFVHNRIYSANDRTDNIMVQTQERKCIMINLKTGKQTENIYSDIWNLYVFDNIGLYNGYSSNVSISNRLISVNNGNIIESKKVYLSLEVQSCHSGRYIFISAIDRDTNDLYDVYGNILLENYYNINVNYHFNKISAIKNEGEDVEEYEVKSNNEIVLTNKKAL